MAISAIERLYIKAPRPLTSQPTPESSHLGTILP